jgi:transcriptional regulator with XRE-family HTH domain
MMTPDTNSIFHVSIGEVVRAWREARGLTVTELAQRSGSPITKGYISQLEHNKVRQPSDDHLVRIATALEIPVLFLVTRRLPSKLSSEEQATLSHTQHPDNERRIKTSSFSFASPIRSSLPKLNVGQKKEEEVSVTTPPQQTSFDEETQLRIIMEKLKELQTLVEEFIAHKDDQ